VQDESMFPLICASFKAALEDARSAGADPEEVEWLKREGMELMIARKQGFQKKGVNADKERLRVSRPVSPSSVRFSGMPGSLLRSEIYIDSTRAETPLCKLGTLHETDKSPYALNSVCSQNRKGYTSVYNLLFASFRAKHVRVAELGIANASSARMWSDFFVNAEQISVFDNQEGWIKKCSELDLPRIKCAYADVATTDGVDEALFGAGSEFDIIIDDSSHFLEHQNNIINASRKHLRKGGMLVIEDIPRKANKDDFAIGPEWESALFIVAHHDNRKTEGDNDVLLVLTT